MATTKITSPDLFDLASLNTALKLPSGTTAQRPTSPSTGEWRYNTTTNLVEFWDGGAWRDLQSENIPPTNSENFNTVLYTGNGSTQSITGVGFKPDWVWIKERSATESHRVFDTTRGATKRVFPNTTSAESTASDSLTSFDADGFSLGSSAGINENSQTYVAWCWKANGGTTSSNTDGTITSTVQVNTKAGFSIMRYTGNGTSGATIGHGLGAAPDLIISRNLTSVTAWGVYHKYNTASPAGQRLKLDLPDLTLTTNDYWAGVEPTSTVLSVGTEAAVNDNTKDYIMYAFKAVAGYSAFGSYAGNASDNGPILNTGFEPAWLMIKVNTGSADGWFMVDNKRETSNPRGDRLFANSDVAEASEPGAQVDFLSNGFQIRGTGGGQGQVNSSGSTYVYIAFASDASAAPSLTASFANKLYTGNGTTQSITGLGFSPSWVWTKSRTNTNSHALYDSVRGINKELNSNSTDAEGSLTDGLSSFDTDGFTVGARANSNQNSQNFVAWNWKANPVPTINTDGTIQSIVSANQAAGFSIIQYTGTGANATVGHGLSAAPELVIVKKTSGVQNWMVGATVVGWTKYLELNTTNAAATASTTWNDTAPTTTTVSLGSSNNGNTSGQTYIMYAFHSVGGFSDIGYWQGGTTTITTGFQPSFVINQDYGLGGGWGIFDSARSGQVLSANTNAAESSSSFVTFTATGFTVPSETSSVFRLYMAFKENPAQYPIPSGYMGYLVVAGGGGGGAYNGGGGGSGGLRTTYGTASGGGASVESNITLSAQTYTITVGAGGSGQISNTASISGSSSSVASITSIGGGSGGGAPSPFYGPNNGGSGGGGTYSQFTTGGTGTANQGFAGGDGDGGVNSGGGGGAGSAGTDATGVGGTGGNGGNGLTIAITGSSGGYAGGGGGAGYPAGGGAAGSATSGGGSGGANSAGAAGAANTGGGGGGSQDTANPPNNAGGNGGSGVVVLRMNTSDYSGTTTGSPTVTTNGSETILTYTGSGTYVHS